MLVSARNSGSDESAVAQVLAGCPTHMTSNTLTAAAMNARVDKVFMAVPSLLC
jgi:hypothetical protein